MKRYKLIFCLVVAFALTWLNAGSQVVFEHISSMGIYEFLDEMANLGMVDINSAVKPYSRKFIAEKLQEANKVKSSLSARQKEELDFYLQVFSMSSNAQLGYLWKWRVNNPESEQAGLSRNFFVHYKDSLLNISFRPVLGLTYFGNDIGNVKHRWNGAEVFAHVGNNLGVYASLRDNNESERISSPLFFNQVTGAPVKNFGAKGLDYSESRGGVVFSWKWGAIGLVKDHFLWGDNYHGANIFSGKTPSLAHITFKLYPTSWLEFNYIHAWLVSNVVDSSRSYWDTYVYRPVFHNKFLAANLLTITPFRGLKVSFGNSIIYSDLGVHPGYLNPFMFYKSVDHTLNNTNQQGETGQNAQMFLNISSRQILGLHIYSALFLDELNISRIKEGKIHNYFSLKAGIRSTGLIIPDLILTAEFTLTKPLTYTHKISTTTFTSNDFNLGHYLRDNSKELYLAAAFKPLRGIRIQMDYCLALHFNDYLYDNRPSIDEYQPFKDLTWQSKEWAFRLEWEILYNAGFRLSLTSAKTKGYEVDGEPASYYLVKYTPKIFQGNHTNLIAGIYLGF